MLLSGLRSPQIRPAGAAQIILGGRFGEEPSSLSWQRLDRFAEAGGRVVDTAHIYADGRSEAVIGDWMQANPGTLIVVDKVGHPSDDQPADLSLPTLRREVAESRRRLRVPAIDVLLLHRDAPWIAVQEVATTLVTLAEAGEAREIGVSNWSAARLDQLAVALAELGHLPLVSYQRSLAVPVRPLWPGTYHADPVVLDTVARYQLTMLAWAAQARGFFTGTIELVSPEAADPFDSLANHARRRRCCELAYAIGSRPETVALAWLLSCSETWPIIGPRSISELDASLEAARLSLDAATLRWLAGEASDR